MKVRTFTPRGFEDFCDIVDSKGNQIVVRESSSDLNCVWIFARGSLAPHLTAAQAKVVAEALLAFVAKQESKESLDAA